MLATGTLGAADEGIEWNVTHTQNSVQTATRRDDLGDAEHYDICIEGYTIVKKNRNRHGGGVLLHIKDGIQNTEITNLAGSEVEGAWANIQCDKQHLALGVMNRPPSSHNAYIKYMLD